MKAKEKVKDQEVNPQQDVLIDLPVPDEIRGGSIQLTSANKYQGTTTVDGGTLSGTSHDVWSSSLGSVDVH